MVLAKIMAAAGAAAPGPAAPEAPIALSAGGVAGPVVTGTTGLGLESHPSDDRAKARTINMRTFIVFLSKFCSRTFALGQ